MPAYFLDSRAPVKRYAQEPGSGWVHALTGRHSRTPIYVSELSRVEVVAALRRSGRLKGLHQSFVDTMVNAFARHLALSDIARKSPVYRLVPISSEVLEWVASLCNRHAALDPFPIRSLDAIQLASAILTASFLHDALIVVTADARLAALAESEDFRVVNPEFPPSP